MPPRPRPPPSGLPTRGSPPGAPAHNADCLPPPGGRGRSESSGPAPPPGARGGRHGARGTGAIGAAPSLSLLEHRVRRGGARVRVRGPLPFPVPWLACSLPPSQLRRVTALAPRSPAASAAAPPFRVPGPRLGVGSTSGPGKTDQRVCARALRTSPAPNHRRLPAPPLLRAPLPPPRLPPPFPRFPRGFPRKPGPPRMSLLAAAAARGSGPAASAPIGRPGGTSVICKSGQGGAGSGWPPAARGRDRGRREAGRAHCSKGAEPGGGSRRVAEARGLCSVGVCLVHARNTLTCTRPTGVAGQMNCA